MPPDFLTFAEADPKPNWHEWLRFQTQMSDHQRDQTIPTGTPASCWLTLPAWLPVCLWLWGACATVGSAQTRTAASEVTVAVASDLRYAMDSLVAVFQRQQPGISVTPVYGSSGKFFQQISHDAPFDLFFSADIEYPRQLKQRGLTASPIQTYGIGRLVLWSQTLDPNGLGIKTLLNPKIRTIAIANPLHAPYGKRAEESLRYYGLYDQVKGRFVKGENIAQTAQFVATGAADIGIIALSLVLSPPLRKKGRYFLIPAHTHAPLQQGHVVLKRAAANKAAFAFSAFMTTPQAQAVLKQYGFSIPKP